MLTPFTFIPDLSGGRSFRHLAFLSVIIITLLSSGCSAVPEQNQVAHTANVISRGTGTLDLNHAANPYGPSVNPVKILCPSREVALRLGESFAHVADASLLITSGTNSMEPLIHGCSYIVVQYRPYDTIAEGDLLVYQGRPDAAKKDRVCMLHRAVLLDQGGWLMSGDNNRWSESWDRVTPVTYLGTVTTILEFPQN